MSAACGFPFASHARTMATSAGLCIYIDIYDRWIYVPEEEVEEEEEEEEEM